MRYETDFGLPEAHKPTSLDGYMESDPLTLLSTLPPTALREHIE